MVDIYGSPLFSPQAGLPIPSRQSGLDWSANLNVGALRQILMPGIHAHENRFYLTFNLFDDLLLTLGTELIEPFGENGVVWRGQLPGVPDVRGYLAVSGIRGSAVGKIVASGCIEFNGDSILIAPVGPGSVRICRTRDPIHYCGGALKSTQQEYTEQPGGDAGGGAVNEDVDTSTSPEQGSIIHVLALYPTKTKDAMGGAVAIDTTMAFAQMQTNEIFTNSGIHARVEISTKELPILRRAGVVDLLADVVGAHDDLDRYGKPIPEVWNAVSKARDEAQAAIVCLLTDVLTTTSGRIVSGAASRIPEPPRVDQSDLSFATFCISLVSGTPTGYLFSHELGHLLGGKHDRNTMDPNAVPLDRKYDYVRGYVPHDETFVTVMGYARPGTPLVPAFSAADRTWGDKPLGIPVGNPNAADAARFFRSIVPVVANYRGPNVRRRWAPVDLQTSVMPWLGGTIIPSAYGPYPPGTSVKFEAIPRENFEFSHWSLDGKDATSSRIMTVLVDRPRVVTANFKAGIGLLALDVIQPPPESNLAIFLTPGGAAYRPGTSVELQLVGDTAKYRIDHWIVDGQRAGEDTSLILRVEKVHRVQVRLRSSEFFIDGLDYHRFVESGKTCPLRIKVFHKRTREPLYDHWVTFSISDAGTGSRLAGPVRMRTNALGEALVTFEAGSHRGRAKVVALLEQSDARPATFEMVVPRYVLVPLNDEYHIKLDGPSTTIEALMREEGRPVSGIEVTFYLRGSTHSPLPKGVALLHQRAVTDANGVARTVLVHTAESSGRLEIHAVYIGSDSTSSSIFMVPGFIE